MGEGLDKNRVFLIEALQELLTSGKNLLTYAMDISETIDSEITTLISIGNQIPGEAINYSFIDKTNYLKGKLKKPEFEECYQELQKVLSKMIENVPLTDDTIGKAMVEITDVVGLINCRITDLRNAIGDPAMTGDYVEFLAVLEEYKVSWDKTNTELKAKFDIIKAMLKGLEQITCEYSVDPVNLATGNFVYDRIDLKIGGANPLVFKRIYNSLDDSIECFGTKWTHNLIATLYKSEKVESITIHFEDSHEEIFLKKKDNYYCSIRNDQSYITFYEETYFLQTSNYQLYQFNKKGECIEKRDSHGNAMKFSYKDGNLLSVSNKSGELHFSYLENGFISQVYDLEGRKQTYTYDGTMLCKVEDESGATVSYLYDADGNILSVMNEQNICQVQNRFDGQGRTIRQAFPDGGIMKYEYKDKENAVLLTQQNGNQITYVHDENYHNTKIIHMDGEEQMEYDKNGRRTAYIDKRGHKIQYKYNEKGDLCKIIDPYNNYTEITYNANRKPVCVRQKDGTKKYNYYDKRGYLIKSIDSIGRKIGYCYGNQSKPKKIILGDYSSYQFTFDERDNITSITDPMGNMVRYEYDSLNHIRKTIDAKGNKRLFEYDRNDRITKVTNSLGNTRQYLYNTSGLVIKFIDFDGSTYQMNYNNLNKLSDYIDPYNEKTTYEYDKMWNVSAVTTANGAKTQYQYHKSNKLAKIIKADGSNTGYEYDSKGNLVEVTLPNDTKLGFEYDALDRNTTFIDVTGLKSCKEYDSMGRVIRTFNENGQELKFIYDLAGQLIEKIDSLGNSVYMTYNALGKLETYTDINGNITFYDYYPGGKLMKLTKPNGKTTTYLYDENGNVQSKTSESGLQVSYRYDELNRLIEIVDSYHRSKKFEYDAVDNVIAVIDENGNRTSYTYQSMKRLTQVTDALGNKTIYSHDCMGRLNGIAHDLLDNAKETNLYEEARELNTQSLLYERNLLGKVTTVTDALGNQEFYEYDSMGNVISHKDKNGHTISYQYNEINKMNGIVYSDGKTVEFGYNELKQLTMIKDWLGDTFFTFDDNGFVKSISDPNGQTVNYQYNKLGQRTSIGISGENDINYTYDNLNRLIGLKSEDFETFYSYDAFGNLKEKTFSNGVKTEFSFNPLGKLTQLTHYDQDGVLDHLNYDYDAVGNKIRVQKIRRDMIEDSGIFDYEYDALNRLIRVSQNVDEIRYYSYDGLGNRMESHIDDNKVNYTYNALSQLIMESDSQQQKEFTYDLNGNLISVNTNGSLTDTYDYDIAGHLIRANEKEFQYNGIGSKVSDSDGNYVLDLTKRFHNILKKDDHNYLWDQSILGQEDSFYLQDELGSPMRRMSEDGALLDSYSYDEFGKRTHGAGRFTYTGYEDENGICFAQARYYDPSLGRFLSRDKVKGFTSHPFTLNEYVYVYNNPLKYVDLDGNFPSFGDVGDALSDFAEWVGETACDAGEVIYDGVTTGVEYVADGIMDGADFVVDTVSSGVDYAIDAASAGLEFVQNNVWDPAVSFLQDNVFISPSEWLDRIQGVKCYFADHTFNEVLGDLNDLTHGVFKNTVYAITTGLANMQIPERIEAAYEGLIPAPLRYVIDKGWSAGVDLSSWAMDKIITDDVEDFGVNGLLYPIAGYGLGFHYDPEKDVYYTTEGSLQQQFGFGDAFDKIGPLLGMDLEAEPIVFTYNGKEYLLEPWMGKYGFGFNTGGEIGIYSRSQVEALENPYIDEDDPNYESGVNDDIYYQSATEDEQLKIYFELYDGSTGEKVVEVSSKEGNNDYWALAITSFDNTDKEDLVMKAKIESEDEDYLDAIKSALLDESISSTINNGVLSFVWNPNNVEITEGEMNAIINRANR